MRALRAVHISRPPLPPTCFFHYVTFGFGGPLARPRLTLLVYASALEIAIDPADSYAPGLIRSHVMMKYPNVVVTTTRPHNTS
jgi:hypothetical protein